MLLEGNIMGKGKEAFIVETLLKLLNDKTYFKEYGVQLRYMGDDYDIHRKTKWKALKNLEKDGYLRREGNRWFMSDELWDRLVKIIRRLR